MNKSHVEPKPKSPRGAKTICIPFEGEAHYRACLDDLEVYSAYLKRLVAAHPELFPPEIGEGFSFHGTYSSKKQAVEIQRIKLEASGAIYQIRPSHLMPYMIAKTDEIEKALFLRRWNVPFDALAYVFGRDPMFWYRATLQFGRPSMVGTTVKTPQALPDHLVADEKHTWIEGQKVYLATTVAKECFLGVGIAESADTADLQQAYGEFAEEARHLNPDYQPQTVCTDGWDATQNAWRNLFARITVILCFLHAVLKLKDRCRASKEWLEIVISKAWDVYDAPSRDIFLLRVRRLRYWARKQRKQAPEAVCEALLSLCAKAKLFALAYNFPGAHRTSNAIDRLIDHQDRLLYAMRYFHGTKASARLLARAQAMIWNFHPYGVRLRRDNPNRSSPVAELNGFQYHSNWLHNFLISASLAGRRSPT